MLKIYAKMIFHHVDLHSKFINNDMQNARMKLTYYAIYMHIKKKILYYGGYIALLIVLVDSKYLQQQKKNTMQEYNIYESWL